MERTKMPKSERARQFMPFASLRGYDKVIKSREVEICGKKELLAEQAEKLSEIIKKVKKGNIVKVTYYENNGYYFIDGIVSAIDFVLKNIKVIKTEIPFENLFNIEITRD